MAKTQNYMPPGLSPRFRLRLFSYYRSYDTLSYTLKPYRYRNWEVYKVLWLSQQSIWFFSWKQRLSNKNEMLVRVGSLAAYKVSFLSWLGRFSQLTSAVQSVLCKWANQLQLRLGECLSFLCLVCEKDLGPGVKEEYIPRMCVLCVGHCFPAP